MPEASSFDYQNLLGSAASKVLDIGAATYIAKNTPAPAPSAPPQIVERIVPVAAPSAPVTKEMAIMIGSGILAVAAVVWLIRR